MRAFVAAVIWLGGAASLAAQQPGVPLAELKQQAAAGDAGTMFTLGQRLRLGQGTTINLREAAEWYGKAAAKDPAAAMTELARLHLAGRGVARNDLQATNCLRRAAELGHAPARSTIWGCATAAGEERCAA